MIWLWRLGTAWRRTTSRRGGVATADGLGRSSRPIWQLIDLVRWQPYVFPLIFSFVFGSDAGLAAAFACARGFGFAFAFAFTTACTHTTVRVNRGGTVFAFACAFTFTTACTPTAVLVNREGISRATATAGLPVLLVVFSGCLITAEPDIEHMH